MEQLQHPDPSPVQSPMLEAATMERTLPIFLLWSTMDVANRKYDAEFREDVFEAVKRAAAVPFTKMDQLGANYILSRLESLSPKLIYNMGDAKISGILLAVCHFILKLVDEGLYHDPTDQAVLTALALADDARDNPDWDGANEVVAQAQAGIVLDRCRLMGLYNNQCH